MSGHDLEDNLNSNDPMTEKSRALFDRASAGLDPPTANRLRLMRRDAIAGTPLRSTYRWLPLGAAAATVLAVGVAWWLPVRNPPVTTNDSSVSATDQDLLPEDDAEIYDWLGEAPVAVNDTGGSP